MRQTLDQIAELDKSMRKHDRSIRAILQEKGFDMKALNEFTMHHLKRETLQCAKD